MYFLLTHIVNLLNQLVYYLILPVQYLYKINSKILKYMPQISIKHILSVSQLFQLSLGDIYLSANIRQIGKCPTVAK